jgi:hypothetical protein
MIIIITIMIITEHCGKLLSTFFAPGGSEELHNIEYELVNLVTTATTLSVVSITIVIEFRKCHSNFTSPHIFRVVTPDYRQLESTIIRWSLMSYFSHKIEYKSVRGSPVG